MTTKKEKEEIEGYKKELREWLERCDFQVYTILKHCSKSGMLRVIQPVIFVDNTPWYLGYRVAKILGYPYDMKKEGVRIGGVGMDMGFALVYELSCALYKNEDGTYSHGGAYKLKQRWL